MKILIIGSEGYIGRRLLWYLFTKGYFIEGIDAGYYGDSELNAYDGDYVYYTTEKYDVIILLAGHSSPSLCEGDKQGSFSNNVTNFSNLLSNLKNGQRLLYASSASVCNGLRMATEDEKLNNPISQYDMQKQLIEKIASLSEVETIGMRFGVVGGHSENPRLDSIINSVYHDGVNKREVTLNNGSNLRAYLGMNDLCKAVEALIKLPNPEKIYNIASGTDTITYIGQRVAGITNAKVINKESDNNYSFGLNCERINSVVKMTDTIESICADMGDMSTKDKNIYNRNTNLFKY